MKETINGEYTNHQNAEKQDAIATTNIIPFFFSLSSSPSHLSSKTKRHPQKGKWQVRANRTYFAVDKNIITEDVARQCLAFLNQKGDELILFPPVEESEENKKSWCLRVFGYLHDVVTKSAANVKNLVYYDGHHFHYLRRLHQICKDYVMQQRPIDPKKAGLTAWSIVISNNLKKNRESISDTSQYYHKLPTADIVARNVCNAYPNLTDKQREIEIEEKNFEEQIDKVFQMAMHETPDFSSEALESLRQLLKMP